MKFAALQGKDEQFVEQYFDLLLNSELRLIDSGSVTQER